MENVFALNALLHMRNLQSNVNGQHYESRFHTAMQQQAPFHGLKIDTSASRTSVITMGQYHSYSRTFNSLQPMRPIKNLSVMGVGGKRKAIGVIVTLVPFKDLKIVIDVMFLVLQENVPTLYSMQNMIENCLDISIQGQYVRLGQRRNTLSTKKYFLIHR